MIVQFVENMVNNKIKIRKARESDSADIARLHIENIKAGFLSMLGEKLLIRIYNFIILEEGSFCYLADSNGKVIAFISATENSNQLYQHFFRKNFFWGAKIMIIKVFNWKVFKKIIDHLFLSGRKAKLPVAELLAIAVDNPEKRGMIGTQLFRVMRKEFRKRKVKGFITIVGQNLIPSNKFMRKMKGRIFSDFEVHKGEKSNVYIWD